MSRLRPLLFVLVLSLLLAAPPAGASVPQGFVGMDADGPVFDPHLSLAHQLDSMVASGVESLRMTFSWAAAQPYRSWAEVPLADAGTFQNGVGDVPTDFSLTDQVVALAAQRHLISLPVVIYAPSWDASSNPADAIAVAPQSDGPYAAFLQTLIKRYGPDGTFWRDYPTLPKFPIRMWQVWNEPNLSFYWNAYPSAPTYMALVRAAHAAIKAADPGAKLVLAGVPDYAWKYLAEIYKVRGARGLFDVVAVHPYTLRPAGVITFLGKVRQVMDQNRDAAKPMLATEVSWPSALGQTSAQLFGIETTEAGQADKIATLLPMLAAHRKALGLSGFYYYTWVAHEFPGAPSFNFAGLFRFEHNRVIQKPAFAAWRTAALALEGCRVKAKAATGCAKPG